MIRDTYTNYCFSPIHIWIKTHHLLFNIFVLFFSAHQNLISNPSREECGAFLVSCGEGFPRGLCMQMRYVVIQRHQVDKLC